MPPWVGETPVLEPLSAAEAELGPFLWVWDTGVQHTGLAYLITMLWVVVFLILDLNPWI